MFGRIAIMRCVFRIALAAFMVAGLLATQTAAAAGPATPNRPLAQLLNPDGTLSLKAGFSGTLDAGGYAVNLDPARGPVFSPTMTLNAWNALGGGLNNLVYTVAVSGGHVYVGGFFTNAGGDPNADYIADWDGTSWSALGSGLNNQVNTIAVNGTDLYVGGKFTDAGGNANADYIARWNGSAWTTLGNGVNNTVFSIAVSGLNIYVAGLFTNAGVDANADYIAKLDGGTWAALGATPLLGEVGTIAISGADVYAGGGFQNAGGNANADFIARWDGTSWSALGTALNGSVSAIALDGSNVYVGGQFTDAGGNTSADKIAKWDGTSWSALGGGLSSFVNSIVVSGGNLYVGGNFQNAGGNANADYIAKWDGTSWLALGATPLNASTNAIAISGTDAYVGGSFTNAGGAANANNIARFQIDASAPTVTSFAAPPSSTSLAIPITDFSASDNLQVSAYLITTSETPPTSGAAGWAASAPTSYTVPSEGAYTLYPWAKDTSGNISAVYGAPASVIVDTTAPTVTAFSASSPSSSLNIPITAFSASDANGIAGYLISTSSGQPAAGAAGWLASAPSSYSVGSYGNYTLYPWAKDTLGNVSAVYGSPVSVLACLSGTLTVTSSGDSGAGTLRQAIADACPDAKIIFASALSGATIRLSSQLTLSKNVTIDGSALGSRITISGDSDSNGTGDVRVFYVNSGNTVKLDSLIVTKGQANIGGAISNSGTLTVANSTISSSASTSGLGGGIYNDGTLAVVSSTIVGNTSLTDGGGLYNYNGSTTITNSTITGNSAVWGGGIISNQNTLTITNSTISGNSAGAGHGGNIDLQAGTLNYANTIVANATSGGDCLLKFGTIGTNTSNLVEDGSCSASMSGDPKLGALASNGGSTQTLALLAGSSAIDAGNDSICANAPVGGRDQRGVARPNGAHCDLGAYEYVDTSAPAVTSFTATSPSASLAISISSFSATDDVIVSGYLITESPTPPSAGAAAWTASAPTSYTVASQGSHTLYPWAKDATSHVSAVYGVPATVIVDTSAPTVTLFTATSPTASLAIPIAAFSASDNVAVSDYLITESATPPSVGAAGWTTSAPTTYTVGGDGSYILYPWAKDATGHVSAVYGEPASVSVDTVAPAVTLFGANSASASLDIPITTFSASDNLGVGGYIVTESATPPSASAAGWAASAPATYTVGGDGSYTLYPWVKDMVGNVSAVYGSPASVSVDTGAPSVTSSARINANPTSATSVSFLVTFSEAVSGGSASDFSLVTSGVSGASITGVSGSGSARTISVNTGSGSGSIRLDIPASALIMDLSGNPLDSIPYTSGQTYTIDKTAPTAASLAAPDVTTSGGATYSFSVTFSDNLAIDSASLGGSNIRVTGPGGFTRLATLVGVTPAGNGALRTVTYQITAPGGGWDTADSGTYTIAVEANQIFDSAGNAVGAGSLGSFQVSLNYSVYLPLMRQ